MGKTRDRWWGFVRRMIQDYPALEREAGRLRQQSTTVNLSAMPKGGGKGRSAEAAALRELPKGEKECFEAVAEAVRLVGLRPDGKERLRLVELMYWVEKPMSASAASLHLHISERTAKRWHGQFVRLVARCYGLTE